MNKNKQNLLYVLNSDWYFNLHWLDRAIAAKNAGFNIHVAVPATKKKELDIIKSHGFKVHIFRLNRSGLNPFIELYTLYTMYKIVKKIDISIVHAITIKPIVYVGLLLRKKRIPLIITFAGLGTLSTSKNPLKRFVFWMICNVLKFITNKKSLTALFENQEDMDNLLNRKVIQETSAIRVYGAGVDTEKYINKEENKDTKIVLFAARLLKDKGLNILIEAMNKVKKIEPTAQLRVAGILDTVSFRSYTLEEIEKYHKNGDIEWLGERKDIPELISNANIVCLPTSYGEGIPRILIEASCAGRAIITTPLGGCKDICIHNKNGIQVPPNDVNLLSHSILKLLQDAPLRKEFGEYGRQLVIEKFTNEKIIAAHLTIYFDSLNKKSGMNDSN